MKCSGLLWKSPIDSSILGAGKQFAVLENESHSSLALIEIFAMGSRNEQKSELSKQNKSPAV